MRSCLYVGRVRHRRTRPRTHALRYRLFTLLLDLDEIDAIARRVGPFSRNRFNLFAFHDADFGDGRDGGLRGYVARELAAAGLDAAPARVLISCCPRVLGHAFNPLALFYCLDARERLYAVVHEVHNTFGERHAYALPVEPPRDAAAVGAAAGRVRQRAAKALHVSPFNPMAQRYDFRLGVPGERQVVAVSVSGEDGRVLRASYVAVRRPLDARGLLGALAGGPLSTLKVLAAIHWEAARLWGKGVPWFRHRPKDSEHAPRPRAAAPDARDHAGER